MLCASCICFVFLSQKCIALHVPKFLFIYLYNFLIGCLALANAYSLWLLREPVPYQALIFVSFKMHLNLQEQLQQMLSLLLLSFQIKLKRNKDEEIRILLTRRTI